MYIPDDIEKQLENIHTRFHIICIAMQIISNKLAIDNRFDEETKAQFNELASMFNNLISNESE